MPNNILTVVTLGKDSAIAADAVQNSFAFGVVTGDTTEFVAIETALKSFYNDVAPTLTVMQTLSESISTATDAHLFQHYVLDGHLDGSPHGSPVRTTTWSTVGGTGTGSLPSEVAACLSFHSAYGSDVEFSPGSRPRARDRGRIYIGPLCLATSSADGTTHEVRFGSTYRSTIATAAARLRDDVATVWSVWSRADAELKPVTAGWVDNAFDIQRRRGVASTLRSTW